MYTDILIYLKPFEAGSEKALLFYFKTLNCCYQLKVVNLNFIYNFGMALTAAYPPPLSGIFK